MSELGDLIHPSAIRLDVPAADWREAIRVSGALLTDSGVAGQSYTDSMISVVEEHGPYIVITPGFALAHSRPDDSVTRTGMSFVRLAEPVSFGHESNDPVTIVMGLAATGSSAHQSALASLAGVLADPDRRAALDTARSAEQVLTALGADGADEPPSSDTPRESSGAVSTPAGTPAGTATDDPSGGPIAADTTDAVPSKNLILTVCGNGLGTSLFLKNTAEKVLDQWGWTPFLTIEATDTISAKGKAKDADLILTSGAIADTLGDVGVPVEVVENFTSTAEIDAALRRLYAI